MTPDDLSHAARRTFAASAFTDARRLIMEGLLYAEGDAAHRARLSVTALDDALSGLQFASSQEILQRLDDSVDEYAAEGLH